MSNNPQYPGFQPLRPPNGGPIGSAQDFAPSMNFQFRPTILAPQSEQFVAMNSQNFQSFDRGGTAMNFGFPPQSRPPQFIASMPQFFERPNRSSNVQQVAIGPPELIAHLSGPMASRTSLPQPGVQNPVSFTPAFGGPGTLSPSFSGASVGHTMVSASTMYPAFDPPLNTFVQTKPSEEALREWVEHTSVDGRRYFFNKRTKQSTWEKPFELMTQLERADATTNWKEHAGPDGRKYYYNKVTKQSTWSMPEELKWARERLEKASVQGPQPETSMNASKTTSNSDLASSPASTVHSSQVLLMPSTSSSNEKHVLSSQEAASAPGSSSLIENVKEDKMITHSTSQLLDTVATANASANAMKTVSETLVNEDKISAESSDGPSADDAEQGGRSESKESQKNTVDRENIDSQLEGKRIQQELVSYTNKLEAMDAFISLLESAKVGSDWTWEQAMRVIITDRRYGALRTLGERKQAFSEFLIRKKKEEAEERQVQQNKRREEFKKMLEDCVEITPSIRWSKAVTMLEGDERFKALDREKDRRDIFEDHIDELKEKERVKALEERKRNITEYRNFLESCNFIKPNSQWRKVQDRLEADERCLRLEKIDRIEIFQEYLRDLEREEEERKKIRKEELKKAERKNRDEFRKLIDEHIEAGALTAKTSWRDYLTKVRDLPAYSAIVSNTSGATPKDLFEDAVEDLQKKHRELKSRIKDSLKRRKLTLSPASTFDEFKVSISEEISLSPVADVYLKLVFDDLLERAKEKEEKEARKRKRLAEDLVEILRSFKDITASSSWDDCKHLVEGSQECSSIGDESFRRQTFEDYVSHLKERVTEIKRREEEKEAEREEQDKQKAKHRREDSKGRHEKVSVDHGDHSLIKGHAKEHRRSGRGSSNKHREQCGDLKESETSHRKGIHKRVSGHDISRQQWPYTSEEQDGTREKRSRKDNENGKRCKKDDENGEEGNQEDEELEDGECGRY